MAKYLAIVAYRCEVAEFPHTDCVDIQAKYFEFENESQIEAALIAEPNHSYLNVKGEKVEWLFSDLLITHYYDEPEHGKELCGYHISAEEIPKLSSPTIRVENKKRTYALNTESAWLLALTPENKAKFLATLSFNLTIVGRDSYEMGTMGLDHPEQLRYINEIQHRISQTLLKILKGCSEEGFEESIIEQLIGEADKNQRGLNGWAWEKSKTQFQIE